ncbi:hypothetical protein TELCIR_16953, partial [Teladorsagia circumcincta]
CACCCKKFIIHPLTILSFLVTVFLLVAVIVYAVNNKGDLGDKLDHKDQFGYSFWLSACALVLAAVDTVIAELVPFNEKIAELDDGEAGAALHGRLLCGSDRFTDGNTSSAVSYSSGDLGRGTGSRN